jgi:hypothetical protein
MNNTNNHTPQECAEFQEQLPELFDIGADLTDHPHLSTCENCSALVRDLEYIAAQAKLLLPIHDPSPEVWKNINNALNKASRDRSPTNGEKNS